MNTTLPTMEQLIEVLPILLPILVIQIGLIIYCLKKVVKKNNFNFLNKKVWIMIILFVQLFGPIAYLALEREDD